jgi:membrane protein DedA with SNARE-associated domain
MKRRYWLISAVFVAAWVAGWLYVPLLIPAEYFGGMIPSQKVQFQARIVIMFWCALIIFPFVVGITWLNQKTTSDSPEASEVKQSG